MTASFVTRVGLAIAQPRTALAIAGDRRNAGRSGSDLLLAIAMLLVATQLRAIVGAAWLAAVVAPAVGLRALVHLLTGTLTVDLGFLVVGALLVFAASGPRRELGRAFDLACVAALPLVIVELVATTATALLDLDLPGAAMWGISGAAYAWTGALLALAAMRSRAAEVVTPMAKRAGWTVIAVAVVGVVVQVVWLTQHMDRVRPMTAGDPAPAFSLPSIGAEGRLGPRVALTPGKVTILDFWATWCGPCLAAMPRIDALAKRHPGLIVLAINLDDPAAARALFDERGYTMTLVADDGNTGERYGVTTIPHTVVIDREGKVRRVAHGAIEELEAEVSALQ